MVFGNTDLGLILRDLENMGFYEVLLPFLLIFTIIFAILQKISLFGQNSKNINIVVAVIIAFFVVRVPSIVEVMSQFLPKVSALVLVLLMFLLVIGIFGATGEGISGAYLLIAMATAIVGIIWAVVSSIPSLSMPSWLRLDTGDISMLVLVAAIIIGFIFITREGKGNDNNGPGWDKFAQSFGSAKLRGNKGGK